MIEHIKRLFRHTLTYGFATVLTNIISFLLLPLYTHYLVPKEYAIVDLVTTLNNILSIVLVLGLNASLTIFYYHSNNEDEVSTYYSTIINFVIIISILIILVIGVYNNFIGIKVIKNIPQNYIKYALLISGLGIFLQFPMSLLQMRERSKLYGLVSVSQFTTTTLLTIIFVVALKQGALGVLRATLISTIIFFVVAAILSNKLYKLVIDFEKLKEMLKVSLPVLPHQLASWGLTFADRIILNNNVSLDQLGVYSFAYKVGMIMSVVAGSINQAWAPFFMDTAKNKGEEAKKIFSKINKYYFIIVGFICFTLCLFAKEIVKFMAPKAYQNSEFIVILILISYFMNGLYFMIVNSLFYTKKTFYLPISTMSSVITNVIINLILVPKYGIYGAAIANLVAFTVLFLVVYSVNLKVYGIKMPFKNMAICSLIYVLSYIIINNIAKFYLVLNIIIKSVMCVLVIVFEYSICLNKSEKSQIREIFVLGINKFLRKQR